MFSRFSQKERGERGVGIFDRILNAAGLFSGMRSSDDIWYPHSLEQAKARWDSHPDAARAKIRLIHGTHIEYGLHEALSLPMSYFTMLREPVNRAISHYYFGKEKRLSPDDPGFLDHYAACVEPNIQTRLLAGPRNPDQALSPDEMLDRARKNLRACAAVGLMERFDESMLLYQTAFGWRMPFYKVRNVGRRRPPLDAFPQAVLRRIEDDNRLDAALYETAREVFEAGVRAYGSNFEGDVRRFRVQNRRWRRWVGLRDGFKEIPDLVGRHVIDPVYEFVARWGGFRPLVPVRLRPRVERNLENGRLYFDLKMGRRLVGSYDPFNRHWIIGRPAHWFLDERALPFSGLPNLHYSRAEMAPDARRGG